jgi:hypothetical protein
MDENKIKIYSQQETCRFSSDDLDYIHEIYEDVIGDTKKIPIGKLIPMLFIKASQVSGQKVVPDLQVVQERDQLKLKLEEWQNAANSNARTSTELQLRIEKLEAENQALADNNRVIREATEGAIICNFDEKQKGFINSALAIYQKEKQANTFEEMIWKIITAFQQMGYLRFTDEDIKYLQSLKTAE